ncbi:DUF7096 domain-containing protein [Haloparvum sedimenti]|uniref:DUF7096 domain-containing protein n=1 Tax=Haloparvum sedimenti TaxID=1678448 RepID=UPI00071E9836|nr:hypothetical protein [Haloparvum sedimenti]
MKRSILAVLLAVAVLAGAGPVAALAGNAVGQADGTEANGTETESGGVAPGEQFGGSVSVSEAELEGELDVRAFDRRVAEAPDDDARAAVVAGAVNGTAERLAELRERRNELRERHENGTMSEGEYRVRTARLAAELSTAERVANRSAAVADGLPNETLAANGVDAERIETLRSEARDLRGGEVAEIARGIAGANAGGSPGSPPADRGPAGTPGAPGGAGGGDDRPGNEARNGSTSGGAGTADGTDDDGAANDSSEESDRSETGGSGDSTEGGSTDDGSTDGSSDEGEDTTTDAEPTDDGVDTESR